MSVWDSAPKPMAELREGMDVDEAYGYDPEQEEEQDDSNFLDKMLSDMKAKRQRSMQTMQGVR
ncbi:MAG: hypothetical protein DRN81_02090 [Thermoproteota archaeon]|nr:MAG: hypothetical protein DRN81_02090 [Candidatus Korarchaeota archaeon]